MEDFSDTKESEPTPKNIGLEAIGPPIATWRNVTIDNFNFFIEVLPKQKMSWKNAKEAILKNWENTTHWKDKKHPITTTPNKEWNTAYQLATQLGLYYVDKDTYYPRFTDDPTITEKVQYIRNWLNKYFLPNPYTEGFKHFEDQPLLVHSRYCSLFLENNGSVRKEPIDWKEATERVFEGKVGRDDILKNAINTWSDILQVEKNNLKLKYNISPNDLKSITEFSLKDYVWNDKAKFFQHFRVDSDTSPNNSYTSATKIVNPHNWLIYGAPGTGKSHFLDKESKAFQNKFTRVTFYPDYSYSKFIGNYKPVSYYKNPAPATTFHKTKKSNDPCSIINEPVIDYTFSPGPFLEALVESIKSEEPYLLIIEELNRANAAAVFGEIFQLLDRDKGVSRYKVKLSSEATAYLEEVLGGNFTVFEEDIFIPANLYIWATMNSADQGVYPLDAAFKRRWSTKYMPLNPAFESNERLKDAQIEFDGVTYWWDKFRKIVNDFLSGPLKVAEDRLIGPYFLSEEEMKDAKSVKYKLILYLRDDVLRHNHSRFFVNGETFQQIMDSYGNGNILKDGIKELLQDAVILEPISASESSTPAGNIKTTGETTDIPQPKSGANEAASEINNDVEIREEENDTENAVKQD
ncbi:AAA family ATPase [Rufibacter aurantiacus]|uniref:AAA family ATPase n=1 Tax=Rufibacter aurantiacus TaxID=2817374 RepID=UPI001B30E7BE|nr:AAA family ATPase [Rufibacter aurantiacus]